MYMYIVFLFQLKSAQSILEQSHQPYQYLVDGIKVRDQQIAKKKDRIASLETQVGYVTGCHKDYALF